MSTSASSTSISNNTNIVLNNSNSNNSSSSNLLSNNIASSNFNLSNNVYSSVSSSIANKEIPLSWKEPLSTAASAAALSSIPSSPMIAPFLAASHPHYLPHWNLVY